MLLSLYATSCLELKLKLEIMHKKQGPKISASKQEPCLTQDWRSDVEERQTE